MSQVGSYEALCFFMSTLKVENYGQVNLLKRMVYLPLIEQKQQNDGQNGWSADIEKKDHDLRGVIAHEKTKFKFLLGKDLIETDFDKNPNFADLLEKIERAKYSIEEILLKLLEIYRSQFKEAENIKYRKGKQKNTHHMFMSIRLPESVFEKVYETELKTMVKTEEEFSQSNISEALSSQEEDNNKKHQKSNQIKQSDANSVVRHESIEQESGPGHTKSKENCTSIQMRLPQEFLNQVSRVKSLQNSKEEESEDESQSEPERIKKENTQQHRKLFQKNEKCIQDTIKLLLHFHQKYQASKSKELSQSEKEKVSTEKRALEAEIKTRFTYLYDELGQKSQELSQVIRYIRKQCDKGRISHPDKVETPKNPHRASLNDKASGEPISNTRLQSVGTEMIKQEDQLEGSKKEAGS